MKHRHSVKKLAKFLSYLLGRRPDEFGLCPDENGYVKIKDLMKALAEEAGWRHVRQAHIREVLYTASSPPVEIAGGLIRAADRSRLPVPTPAKRCPKLLYVPVRQRAYPVVHANGLEPVGQNPRIVLTSEQPMAERMGRRVDASPVVLTVHTSQLAGSGVTLRQFGRQLFTVDRLPVDCFSGPPLPPKPPEPGRAKIEPAPASPKTPGSYLMDADRLLAHGKRPKGARQRKNDWKRERTLKNRNRGFRTTDR
jgi:putative RNA 2'-phosphotransferase